MRKSLLVLTTLVSVGFSAPAFAGMGGQEPRTQAVRTDDLNLVTPEGQARLEKRVEHAARAVCWSGDRGLASLMKEQACFKTAMKSAQVQVASLVQKAVRAKS